ncbi:2-oxoglutarate and iron-dependent oxygenase domain-containing protein [Telmatospirillum sp.]|uniref:isopenicillin N synthase family dioxygenase n=1 Tax=Telmatospirillum sp. TaxID=2079197 RepID=UPI00283AC98A|nr:2-oxoglutarate and iron-dependent oxygenase domain-containing protein [Telmatospirillum sp.]MDR3435379.1 2-oxoglutarate and iron-dependent oxygenase domain-containing protein [Telmatospirillum sp.]
MSSSSSLRHLPILDLARFTTSPRERGAFLTELRDTARNVGFFYLAGHGISDALAEEAFSLSRRFFDLPSSEKLAIEMVYSPHFRGYTPPGREYTRGSPDWREELDVGLEAPALQIGPETPAWKRLQGPNQWPAALPELRPVLLHWQSEVIGVATTLLKAFALALGQPEDTFQSIYSGTPNQLLKTILYPARDKTTGDQGCGPHKDGGFLTLLRQHQIGGLQVETEHGWIDAPPIPGTFVVNIGELLELASDGYLRANVHRVITPPAGVDRQSLAFFLGARPDSTIPRLSLPAELVPLARGPEDDPDNPLFYDVGHNILKSRLRSHPDVARRHYADLLDAGFV